MIVLAWVCASLAVVAASLTLFNLLTWPRGRREARFDGRVSVLVPARDEEGTIGACVQALLDSTHPVHEVIVIDDGSTDRTPEILRALATTDPRLRVIPGTGLPPGWVGKPHACHQLAQVAAGELLLFVDADVTFSPHGIGRIAGLVDRHQADVVTAVPAQRTGSFLERLVLPLLHVTYTAWLPLVLVHRTHDPRFLAANGQILAIKRGAYDAIGGFEGVKNEVVDDMALCRAAKVARRRVVFADGSTLAHCRMYSSAGEVWRGFSKNLYEGLGESPLALLAVVGVYLAAFVAPIVLLAASPWVAGLWLPAAVSGTPVYMMETNLAGEPPVQLLDSDGRRRPWPHDDCLIGDLARRESALPGIQRREMDRLYEALKLPLP